MSISHQYLKQLNLNQMDTLDQNILNKDAGELNGEIKSYLLETAKWAKFLSILGFIGLGIVILGLFGVMAAGRAAFSELENSSLGSLGGAGMGMISLLYMGFAALYFFPLYYLYKAADGLQKGIRYGNNDELTNGFRNFKSHYKFIGIFTIIVISIYLVILLIGMLAFAGR
jgi:hypothetical protein